ncbi:MAG: protein kinase [Planctomycetota bacterium]
MTWEANALIGQTLGQFELKSELGRGGMAVVYKGYQPSLDRWVAIKTLPAESSANRDLVSRFHREAEAMVSLNHTNIVQIIDKGQDKGLYFFAMEFVEGPSLADMLKQEQMSMDLLFDVALQVCDGLEYAHRKGIVHRDMKPGNVLFEQSTGLAKVADFGIARLTQKSEEMITLTATNVGMGTMNYMAPEQKTDAGSVDHRADIYSVGVMIYEMFTGKLPMGRFKLPTKLNPALPRRLDDIVSKCLEADPVDRYASMAELRADLELARGESGGGTLLRSVRDAAERTLTAMAGGGGGKAFLVGCFLFLVGGLAAGGWAVKTFVLDKQGPDVATKTDDPKTEKTEPPKTAKTDAPKTTKTDAPKTQKTEAPKTAKTDAPKTQKTDAPKTQKTDAPKTQKTEAPKTEAPKTEAPKTEEPKTEEPKTQKTDGPKTEAVAIRTGGGEPGELPLSKELLQDVSDAKYRLKQTVERVTAAGSRWGLATAQPKLEAAQEALRGAERPSAKTPDALGAAQKSLERAAADALMEKLQSAMGELGRERSAAGRWAGEEGSSRVRRIQAEAAGEQLLHADELLSDAVKRRLDAVREDALCVRDRLTIRTGREFLGEGHKLLTQAEEARKEGRYEDAARLYSRAQAALQATEGPPLPASVSLLKRAAVPQLTASQVSRLSAVTALGGERFAAVGLNPGSNERFLVVLAAKGSDLQQESISKLPPGSFTLAAAGVDPASGEATLWVGAQEEGSEPQAYRVRLTPQGGRPEGLPLAIGGRHILYDLDVAEDGLLYALLDRQVKVLHPAGFEVKTLSLDGLSAPPGLPRRLAAGPGGVLVTALGGNADWDDAFKAMGKARIVRWGFKGYRVGDGRSSELETASHAKRSSCAIAMRGAVALFVELGHGGAAQDFAKLPAICAAPASGGELRDLSAGLQPNDRPTLALDAAWSGRALLVLGEPTVTPVTVQRRDARLLLYLYDVK